MNSTPNQTGSDIAIIECRQLGKNYGSTRALSDVTLTLHSGQPIALIGPNGAGKTTFMSLLCGFVRPSEGSVKVFGHKPGSHHALDRLSALPQDAWPDPHFSIARQLKHYARLRGLGTDAAQQETKRVLDLVQLSDRSADKPGQLSHGMRKRIMIAQAMIGQPDVILLDEPTAGIDPPNVKIIRELIAAESANATFIISSHNLDELEKVCAKVIHLSDGRLRGISDIDENSHDGYLSITLRQQTSPAPLKVIKKLPGVIECSFRPPTELVIEYDEQNFPATDLSVMTTLTEHKCHYRKLVKGKSLEEQLFTNVTPS